MPHDSILTDADLNRLMQSRPSPVRVTDEMIEARIAQCEFDSPWKNTTLTVCTITLDNGYTVRGESACVDPANFDPDVGRTWAYKDAMRALYPLFGFMLAEDRFRGRPGM